MIHVLTRLDGENLYVLKVGEVDGYFALLADARYVYIGRVARDVSVRDGMTVHEWYAISDGDIYHVRAGTRKRAIELLLDRYGMHQVRDVDTIPTLF